MKLLIIGGTYFLGKAFVEKAAAEGNHLYLLNRGSRPVCQYGISGDIAEYHADRHDTEKLSLMEEKEFDVIVDFCGYSAGDIRTIVDIPGIKASQYIFISTCDVYRRGTGKVSEETAELEDRDFGGEAGAYILGKAELERELKSCCSEHNIKYTSIRPVFIYGRDNYAPREGIFFNWVRQAGQIIFPEDADGEFQMVYVEDVAAAVLKACLNPKAYDMAFNLCGDGIITYEIFADSLQKACGTEFERVNVSVKDIEEKGIPMPFPLTKAESESYCDALARQKLNISYTPLDTGMQETYKWFCAAEE
jgi:nucleoside-diphosphate-sugar epimerase